MTFLIITGLSLKRLLVSLDALTTNAAAGTLVRPPVSAEAGGSGGGQKTTEKKKPIAQQFVSRFISRVRSTCRKRFELTSAAAGPAYHAGREIAQVQMCKEGTK